VLSIDIPAYAAPDDTAPTLTAGAVSRTGDTTATVKFTSGEAGKYYYTIAANAPANAAAVKSADGTSGVSIGATEITVTNPIGLTAGAKTIYIAVEDAAGNLSAVLSINIPAYSSGGSPGGSTGDGNGGSDNGSNGNGSNGNGSNGNGSNGNGSSGNGSSGNGSSGNGSNGNGGAGGGVNLPGGNTVITPADKPPVSNSDGSTTLPGGGTIKTPGGDTITVPPGTTVSDDGKTIVLPGEGGAEILRPGGNVDKVPPGSVIDLSDPKNPQITITLPGGSIVVIPADRAPVVNSDGSTTLPGGGIVKTPDGSTVITLPPGTVIDKDGKISLPSGNGGSVTQDNGRGFNIGEGAIITFDKDKSLGYSLDFENMFEDVIKTDWDYEDVMFVFGHGIMQGTGKEPLRFSPKAGTTRGMVVTVLYRMDGEPLAAELNNPFNDVAGGTWYTDAVKWAAANKIVNGTGGGSFAPDTPVSRQDLAVILYNYAEFAKLSLPTVRDYAGFKDDADTADYGKNAVRALYQAGIINGKPDGLFDPKDTATRAEVAAMLHRFIALSA
jgi:hypothetical protein